MDLAIGLTKMEANIKSSLGSSNKGMDDMEIYCKVLTTEDFARIISDKRIPCKGMTYGEYLGRTDTIEAIQDRINYNYSNKQEALTISFTDGNAVIAAQMLDSVTAQLQAIINQRRQAMTDEALKNVIKEQAAAKTKYIDAQHAYSIYVDSHLESSTQEEKQKEIQLSNEVKLAYQNYKKTIESHTRHQSLKQRSQLSFAVIRANTVPQSSNSNFIGIWIPLLFIALLLTFWYRRFISCTLHWSLGGYFSPWTITIAIWTAVLILISSTDIMDPISNQFWISFCMWIPIFCLSSILTYNLTKGDSISGFETMHLNKSWYYFFFALALILTPLYLYKTYTIISMFDTKDIMLSLRQWTLFGDNYGYLNYAQPILQATLLISIWKFRSDGVSWWHAIILVTAFFLFNLGKMEKLGMFFGFIYVIYVLFEKKVIKIQNIAILGSVLLLVFYFFNLSRQGEDSDYAKDETLLDFIGMYIMSGAVAYGRLRQNISDVFGPETLNTFYSYFYKWILGEQFSGEGIGFREFVHVPISTNVYTIFCPFFCDFGQRGVAFFALVMGTLSGWLYAMSRGDSLLFRCLYTIIVCVLALQFFDEIFIVSIMTYIHTTIPLVLMTQHRYIFSVHRKDSD